MRFFRYALVGLRAFAQVGPRKLFGLLEWMSDGFVSPSPVTVKQDVLRRWGGEKTWVETGTYLGSTTAFLSRFALAVVSIEPSPIHFENVSNRFKDISNVDLVFGYSEEQIEEILIKLVKITSRMSLFGLMVIILEEQPYSETKKLRSEKN